MSEIETPARNSRQRMRAGGSALAAALVLAGCAGAQAERDSAAPGPGRDLRVRRGDFVQSFVLTGELKATRSESILVPRSPTWQVQIRWMEQDGAMVKRGQKVVELDTTALVSELDEKTSEEIRAEIALDQKQADLAGQEQDKQFELEKQRTELAKAEIEASIPEDILRRREYQEKQLALSRARAASEKAERDLESFRKAAESDLEVLRIALEKARREVEAAQRAMDAMVLTAPRDGILIIGEQPWEGRKFQVGDTAWTGLTVARIPDLSAMEVEAYLSDVDDGKIRVGNAGQCRLDAYLDRPVPCEVVEITPIAQEAGVRSLRRAFRVRVSLESTDPERMRPGMSVQVALEVLRMPDALLAARGALNLTAEPPVALLAGGGTRDVQVGPCNALECVVEDGLAEGDVLRRRG